jgi:hypothetical protein
MRSSGPGPLGVLRCFTGFGFPASDEAVHGFVPHEPVHLATSWPSLRSQAVIFRRPYRDSGFCAVSFSALTIVASVTVRAAGALDFQDR